MQTSQNLFICSLEFYVMSGIYAYITYRQISIKGQKNVPKFVSYFIFLVSLLFFRFSVRTGGSKLVGTCLNSADNMLINI